VIFNSHPIVQILE